MTAEERHKYYLRKGEAVELYGRVVNSDRTVVKIVEGRGRGSGVFYVCTDGTEFTVDDIIKVLGF